MKIFVACLGISLLADVAYSQFFFESVTLERFVPTFNTRGYGQSVAITDSFVLVAAPGHGSSIEIGAINVFHRDGKPDSELRPTLPEPRGTFGYALAAAGNVAVVGDFGSELPRGVVYVFDLLTGGVSHILRPDPADNTRGFGRYVGFDGSLAIVSTSITSPSPELVVPVYVFDASSGALVSRILPDVSNARGWVVAIEGDIALLCSPPLSSRALGRAYLYSVSTGQLLHELTPAVSYPGDAFGSAVAISGNLVAIGAPGQSSHGDAGAVYIYDATTGALLRTLSPSDAEPGNEFGHSVALSGNTLLVGALFGKSGERQSGTAYLFDASTGRQVVEIGPESFEPQHAFGHAVGITEDAAVVGVMRITSQPYDSYLYDIGLDYCAADLDRDGVVSPSDFNAWIAYFSLLASFDHHATACDQNGDGSCSPADFSAWVANYNAGC